MNIDRLLFNMASSATQRLKHFSYTRLTRMYAREFDYHPDDIYVATYMKSGTTLLQMMLYQLLTDGEMNFRHIYDVSPWLEQAIDRNRSLKDLPHPRIMKTHVSYRYFPSKMEGRIIYCVRNGMDVAVSMYHHCRDLELAEMPWEDFLYKVFARKSWFAHVSEWLENKKKLNIYYVRYEDLRKTCGNLSKVSLRSSE